MSIFSKAKKYRKPSCSIDEKVKLLNIELKKTGVVFEDAPANSTVGLYCVKGDKPETNDKEKALKDAAEAEEGISDLAFGSDNTLHNKGQHYSPDGTMSNHLAHGWGNWGPKDTATIWWKNAGGHWNWIAWIEHTFWDTYPDGNAGSGGGWGVNISHGYGYPGVPGVGGPESPSEVPEWLKNNLEDENGDPIPPDQLQAPPPPRPVLQQAGLGDPDYYPGDPKAKDKSEEEEAAENKAKNDLGVGEQAWNWLNDMASNVGDFFNDIANDMAAGMGALGAKLVVDKYMEFLNDEDENAEGSSREKPIDIGDLVNDEVGAPALKDWWLENKDDIMDPNSFDDGNNSLQSEVISGNDTLSNVLGNLDINRGDGVEVNEDEGKVKIKKAYDFDGYMDLAGGNVKTTLGAMGYGIVKGLPFHMTDDEGNINLSKDGSTPVAYMEVTLDIETGEIVEKPKEKGQQNESYITEGWASPEHVNVDKNERKRWFNQKDIHPEYPRKAPPKMVGGWHPDLKRNDETPVPTKQYIKIKEVDLIKNYRMKGKEIKKFMNTINSINSYLTRNPSALIHAQQRYPKSDPHLAALNYKMDMQLAAADEYIDKQFPENQRLYNRLVKATKRSIKLTDPKTFKNSKSKMTSVNKLMRVDHVMSEYDVTDKEVKKKKIKSNKKSAGRFFDDPVIDDKMRKARMREEFLKSDWRKELKELQEEMMNTTQLFSYGLTGSNEDHIVVQTGYTGDGDINDFTHGDAHTQAVHHGGEFTAFTAFTSTENAPDPQNMGTSVRSYGGQDENGNYDLSPTVNDGPTGADDSMGNFWPGYTGGLRGTHFYQAYNTFPYTALGGPTDENAVGFNEPDEPQEGILTKIGSAQLVGTGFAGNAGVPRILAMKPVDTTEMDTFSLNWFTLGHIYTDMWSESPTYGQKFVRDDFRPTAQGDGVYLYYWAGDKPGAQEYGGAMNSYGSRSFSGWRPINRKWDGTLDPNVDPHIIPNKPNPVDSNGDRIARGPSYAGPYRGQTFFNHKLSLPEWCRGKDMRFMLIQKRMSQGAAYNRWGLSSVRFQRRKSMNIQVPLDDPRAISFIRLGGKEGDPKKRKKALDRQLKSSKQYVNKVVANPFPGTDTEVGEAQGTGKPYVGQQWDGKTNEFAKTGTLDQQKDKFVSKDVKLPPTYADIQKAKKKK